MLTFIPSGSLGVGKTLIVEGLSEYLKTPLYAVSHIILRLYNRSNRLDFRWGARLEPEDA